MQMPLPPSAPQRRPQMGDVRTWTPTVSYLTDDRGEPLMRPARGGMWVSLGDYAKLENALNRAKADKAAVDAMREACAVIAATILDRNSTSE